MHLTFIIAFAALLWFNTKRPINLLDLSALPSVIIAVVGVIVVWGLAAWSTRHVIAVLRGEPHDPGAAQHCHHLWSLVLHVVTLAALLGNLVLTGWPQVIHRWVGGSAMWGLDDAVILLPFVVTVIGVWLVQYPIDRAIRAQALTTDGPVEVWPWRDYLMFNIRFQFLTIAAPMGVIIVGSDVLDRYRKVLESWAGVFWFPDFLMGVLICAVFALAPLMMRFIWTTESLPDGELRERLETIAARTHLGYRDILIWRSEGMLVNAAVMGIVGPLRYVLLSDGLIEAMTPRQIEAVFGHEAGHVRFWHIPYFIVFATLTMLIGGGTMLLLTRRCGLSLETSQMIVGGVMVAMWGLAFGWLSHQFEYQADVSGARSIELDRGQCDTSCLVHAGHGMDGALCTTAARQFASALRRVAALNGIPRRERGWRHPSINQRILFLRRLSRDPVLGARFSRVLLHAKLVLLGGTLCGLGVGAYIYWDQLWPASWF